MIPNKGLSLDVYAVCSQMWKHTESTLSAHLCDIEACGPQVNFELPKEIGEEEKKMTLQKTTKAKSQSVLPPPLYRSCCGLTDHTF